MEDSHFFNNFRNLQLYRLINKKMPGSYKPPQQVRKHKEKYKIIHNNNLLNYPT